MVKALLDTTIMIDLLRGYAPAVQWIANQSELGIAPIVSLEVMEGAENKYEMQRSRRQLADFELVPVVSEDFSWAVERLALYKLSHNVGMMDCLIALVSYRLQLPLYTGNLKHFALLLGTLAVKPY